MKRKKKGILICGAYGLGNMGDEAILSAILQEIREAAPGEEITVLTRSPKETAAKHGVKAVYTFDFPRIWRAMKDCRLYVNGGGSLIQDVTSSRSLWFYLYTIRAAKQRGCKVLMYGCGIGPVNRKRNALRTQRVLNRCVDAITLRDANSKATLEDLGVTEPEIIIAADPTVILPAADPDTVDKLMEERGMDRDGAYISFTLRTWPGFEAKTDAFAAAARYAYEKYGLTPVFLPIEAPMDTAAAQKVIARLEGIPYILSKPCVSSYQVIGLFARMKAVVSMRLHALVFAAGQGVPLVGIVYDQKVNSFLDYIGQDLYMDLNNVTKEGLRDAIDKAVARQDDKAFLLSGVERLRTVESRNGETAARLLKEERGGTSL